MKQKLIKNIREGDSILSFFVVRKKEIKERKANRQLYLTFEFGDSSGRIRGSIWDHIEEINNSIQLSDIVKVKGKVITYHDAPHISIEKIRKAIPEDGVELQQFLPRTEKNVDQMYDALIKVIDNIGNSYLKKLLYLIFKDEELKQKFINAPAAKLWHHNYLGGLLEHTLSIVEICEFLQQRYPHVDRDIILTAALLHDIGKIAELSTHGFINYSTEGRLIGHITIGVQIVTDKVNRINGFPETLKSRLLHCILSHHGQREFGSPVVPMSLEALILYYADEIDSKVNGFLRIIKKEKKHGKIWSNYVNLLDRFIYLGED